MSRGAIYERVRTHARRARIGKRVSPHTLRHTFATHLVRAGVGLVTIRDLLGHRLITSTQIYLHVTAEDLRSAAASHPIARLAPTVEFLLPNVKLPLAVRAPASQHGIAAVGGEQPLPTSTDDGLQHAAGHAINEGAPKAYFGATDRLRGEFHPWDSRQNDPDDDGLRPRKEPSPRRRFFSNTRRLFFWDQEVELNTPTMRPARSRPGQPRHRRGNAVELHVYLQQPRLAGRDDRRRHGRGHAGTFTYGYDADGQLTSVQTPAGEIITYQYDAAGNRVAVVDNGTSTLYTANNLNEYTQAGNTSYTYDSAGNLISKTDSTGTTTYSYNVLNQLVSVDSPAGLATYQYDALGYLVSQTLNRRGDQKPD